MHTLVSRQKGSDHEDYFLLGFGNSNLVFSSNVWNVRVVHPFPAGDHWVHVAGTRAADGTARLFINGEEVPECAIHKGTGKFEGAEIPAAFESLSFGWNNYQPAGEGFVMWIDDMGSLRYRELFGQRTAALGELCYARPRD